MPALQHTHTYLRYKKRFYRCADPKCTHYLDREFLVGKESLCPDCHTPFILTWEHLRRATPKCLNCSASKKAKAYQTAKGLMDSLLAFDEPTPDKTVAEFKERLK